MNADGKLGVNADVGVTGNLGSFNTSGSTLVEYAQGDQNGAFVVLQGEVAWNFEFSDASTDTVNGIVTDLAGTVSGGNTWRLAVDPADSDTPTIGAATGSNTPAKITQTGILVGGSITAAGDDAFRVQLGTGDNAPQSIATGTDTLDGPSGHY